MWYYHGCVWRKGADAGGNAAGIAPEQLKSEQQQRKHSEGYVTIRHMAVACASIQKLVSTTDDLCEPYIEAHTQ